MQDKEAVSAILDMNGNYGYCTAMLHGYAARPLCTAMLHVVHSSGAVVLLHPVIRVYTGTGQP
jgi:hypothetical protein